ncbi:hypothetical protein AUK10_00355 [Candidatus Gracilibacteria bacterium CG2_30_37_12]|nr:MAG: hypothetical protein AUK10_00355 [Candidatus Gracilibacteria bacterium CG2_30_37_12]
MKGTKFDFLFGIGCNTPMYYAFIMQYTYILYLNMQIMNFTFSFLHSDKDGFQCTEEYREFLHNINDEQLRSEQRAVNAAHSRGDTGSEECRARLSLIDYVMNNRGNVIEGTCQKVADKVYQIRETRQEHRV